MLFSKYKSGVLTCIVLFWLQYVGIVCFLYGFLPMKNPVGGYATPDDYFAFFKDKEDEKEINGRSDLSKPTRMVGQLAFMVIDALRADFVFSFEHINQAGLKFKKLDNVPEQGRNKKILLV